MFNGVIMFSFRGKSHVQKIILLKDMFSCPLKLILGFFAFLAINQNIDTQLCMYVKNHQSHMNYFKSDHSNFLTLICFKEMLFAKSNYKFF
jgi:hypothetical protein